VAVHEVERGGRLIRIESTVDIASEACILPAFFILGLAVDSIK
jgi:hypothetical protein